MLWSEWEATHCTPHTHHDSDGGKQNRKSDVTSIWALHAQRAKRHRLVEEWVYVCVLEETDKQQIKVLPSYLCFA